MGEPGFRARWASGRDCRDSGRIGRDHLAASKSSGWSNPEAVLEPADRPLRTGFRAQDHSIDDGLFEIREIRRLHLRVRLVTLSSCGAGVGPIEESGVADLVNAFGGRRNVSSRFVVSGGSALRNILDSFIPIHATPEKPLRVPAGCIVPCKHGVASGPIQAGSKRHFAPIEPNTPL